MIALGALRFLTRSHPGVKPGAGRTQEAAAGKSACSGLGGARQELLVDERALVVEGDGQLAVRDRVARGVGQGEDVQVGVRAVGAGDEGGRAGGEREVARRRGRVGGRVGARRRCCSRPCRERAVGLELDRVVRLLMAGTTPWKAGTFSVMAVSCQALPVRPGPGSAWGWCRGRLGGRRRGRLGGRRGSAWGSGPRPASRWVGRRRVGVGAGVGLAVGAGVAWRPRRRRLPASGGGCLYPRRQVIVPSFWRG